MFKVTHKTTKQKYLVYNVKYNAAGEALFLIFDNGAFTSMHSKHFKPVNRWPL